MHYFSRSGIYGVVALLGDSLKSSRLGQTDKPIKDLCIQSWPIKKTMEPRDFVSKWSSYVSKYVVHEYASYMVL